MEKILTFDGVNAALTGEEALKAASVPVRVMARPNALGAQCGFCLRVDPENLAEAIRILAQAGVVVKGAYDRVIGQNGEAFYVEIPMPP
jgi:hypothetical protein